MISLICRLPLLSLQVPRGVSVPVWDGEWCPFSWHQIRYHRGGRDGVIWLAITKYLNKEMLVRRNKASISQVTLCFYKIVNNDYSRHVCLLALWLHTLTPWLKLFSCHSKPFFWLVWGKDWTSCLSAVPKQKNYDITTNA